MKWNEIQAPGALRSGPWTLLGARRARVAASGCLQVTAGTVWLTRDGEPDDHVLASGQRIVLRAGDAVLVQPWHDGGAACLRWQADQPRRLGWRAVLPLAFVADALRSAAFVLRGAAERLADWARTAEASASRAQGSMPCGESMASSGALQ